MYTCRYVDMYIYIYTCIYICNFDNIDYRKICKLSIYRKNVEIIDYRKYRKISENPDIFPISDIFTIFSDISDIYRTSIYIEKISISISCFQSDIDICEALSETIISKSN